MMRKPGTDSFRLWKMLGLVYLLIFAGVALFNLCYAQSPTPSLPGTMPNHGARGSVGGPVMVIPPTGSPTFIYPVPTAPLPAPLSAPLVAPAMPLMIIPPVGMPTFVYPGLVQ